jgi:hypothetical protein
MAIPQQQVDEWFREPVMGNGAQEAQSEILAAAKKLAETINRHLPDNQAKLDALQTLRQSVSVCEAHIRWDWPASNLKLVQ